MGPEASPPHTQKLLLPLSWAGGECAIWPYQMADSFDSLTIIISVFHSPNSQNPAGTFCGGWALIVWLSSCSFEQFATAGKVLQ